MIWKRQGVSVECILYRCLALVQQQGDLQADLYRGVSLKRVSKPENFIHVVKRLYYACFPYWITTKDSRQHT